MEKFKDLVETHEGAFGNFLRYAKAFLEHVNPHTGRRYADEPAMPLYSLVNEGDHRGVLSVDNEDIVRARGNELTGLRAGEAVLTIASKEDPSVTVQYKLAVVQPVARINLTPSAKTVPVGGTISLTATGLPEDASVQAGPEIAEEPESPKPEEPAEQEAPEPGQAPSNSEESR